jgi:metal-sulfur cluster biosynthetic enzyme
VEQDISERNTVLNKINDDMHAKYQQILQSYGMFEDRMRQITGDPEWTIDTFLTAARADVYAD